MSRDKQWSANHVIAGKTSEAATDLSETQQVTRDTGALLAKKIWIPKTLYTALPYFYIFAGISALLATIYIGHWFWIQPHYLFFAGACLHMGIMIYRRRVKTREPWD